MNTTTNSMNDTAMTPKPNAMVRNGVDVRALTEAMEAIASEPALASFKFRSKNEWLDGGHNRSTISGFYGLMGEQTRECEFSMDADEPHVLLGFDRGANPVEYVLHALAACVTTTMVYHAAAHGIRIESVQSRLEGDLDLRGLLAMPGAKRNGYERLVMRLKVSGSGTKEQMLEMARLGQAHSPVFDIVSSGTPVEVIVEVA
ncbi:MAG: OsmC family protein [Fimbriimonadaceae bacterium]|nr:OsmC family protein [Fimbriimonadaceae bacterium]QYK55551.1 MAG: OsmC family protein [Fimbriimonadaceae bacterium]